MCIGHCCRCCWNCCYCCTAATIDVGVVVVWLNSECAKHFNFYLESMDILVLFFGTQNLYKYIHIPSMYFFYCIYVHTQLIQLNVAYIIMRVHENCYWRAAYLLVCEIIIFSTVFIIVIWFFFYLFRKTHTFMLHTHSKHPMRIFDFQIRYK